MADDLGYGDLSCFNENSKLNTENLDRLAAEGMRCTDAHASSALCTPSRYGLMTGRYNWRSQMKAGVLMGFQQHLIEPGRMTLGTLFKSQGYRTACIGKWHLGLDWVLPEGADPAPTKIAGMHPAHGKPNGPGNAPGTKMPDGPRGPMMQNVDVLYDQPITDGPHTRGFDYSWVTPGSLDISPYVFVENGKVTAPPNRQTGSKRSVLGGGPGRSLEDRLNLWPLGDTGADYETMNVVPDSAARVLAILDDFCGSEDPFFLYYPMHAPHVPCVPTPEFAGKSSLNAYGDMVLMIDSIVGSIYEKLKSCGKLDNTIFIFTSDNGSEMCFAEQGHISSYIYRGVKGDIWDGGHRIPFIVRWPETIQAGSVCGETVCLCDMMATFAEILGISLADDEGEDSLSNLPLWRGGQEPVREATVHTSGNGFFAIRKGKWKLEMCPDGGGMGMPGSREDDLPPIQLYDMEADVGETTNVYAEHPQVIDELTALLTEYIFSGRSTPGAAQKNTGPERWEQINWMEQ